MIERLLQQGGFNGPPEPTKKNDEIYVKYLIDTDKKDDSKRLQTVKLGTWVCQRCGNEMELGLKDGDFIEPYQCDSCEREGPFQHKGLSDREAQVAKRADTMWKMPSGISDDNIEGLWSDIRQYLQDHWDSSHPELYEGLTAYAISTWVRENLTFVPHLMLMGKTTGGKTRLLNTLSRLSYRAIVSASATPSSMFRLVDGYNVTYYISEYHGLEKDARRELDNIIRGGQKRGEIVTRSEQSGQGYEPDVYDPFSHIAVATQYEPDDDIINRCIQIRSSANDREMPAVFDESMARDIRNRLLLVRFRLLNSSLWHTAEKQAYEFLDEHDIDGRTREKLLSIVTIGEIWDRTELLVPFIERVVRQDREAASESEDAIFVEALRDLAQEEIGDTEVLGDSFPWGAVEVGYTELSERYEQMTGMEKSNSWVGHVRSRLGLDSKRTRQGSVVKDDKLGEKLQKLCDDLNLEFNPEENESADRTKSQQDLHETLRAVLKTHIDQNEGNTVQSEKVVEAVKDEFDESRINNAIENMKQRGLIIENGLGELELTD